MAILRGSVKRLRRVLDHVGRRIGAGALVDTVRALGAPDHKVRKAYQDYRELSPEEIEEKLEKVEGISDEALRVQAGRETADYYRVLRRLHENE